MSSYPPPLVPLAQVVGLTSSAVLAGLIGSISYVAIPSLSALPPALAAKTWQRVYNIGMATAPPMAVTSAICFGLLAVKSSDVPGRMPQLVLDPTSPQALYTAAVVLIPSIVPFTIAFMRATNLKLMEKAREGEKAGMSDEETRELLEKWRVLNFGRAAMVLLGSVLGLLATVVR